MTEHRQETMTIDELSDEVKHAFAEQRDFITFCFDRAQQNLATGLADVREDLTGVKTDLAGVKTDLAGVKTDVAGLKKDMAGVKADLAGVNHRLDRHELVLGEILNEVKKR